MMTSGKDNENNKEKQFDSEKGIVYVRRVQSKNQLNFLINLSLSKKTEIQVKAMGLAMDRALNILYSLQKDK